MFFLSSLLISLYRESVNGVSCTRTDISVYGDCFIDISVEFIDMSIGLMDMPMGLTDMPIEFIDMPAEVK